MNRITALLLGTTTLVASVGVASAAGQQPAASISGHQAQQFVSRAPLKTTLYDQNSNDTGSAINSQNYTSSTFSAYDDQGADDFTIPKGEHWTITEVDVTGQYFNGTGRATSEDVIFYNNDGVDGLPGTEHTRCVGLVGKDNGTGSFRIMLGHNCTKAGTPSLDCCKGFMGGDTYYVSVVVTGVSGGRARAPVPTEWGWEVNGTIHGNEAVWQNPGGGFGVCQTWETIGKCLGIDGDFMFTLKGRAK